MRYAIIITCATVLVWPGWASARVPNATSLRVAAAVPSAPSTPRISLGAPQPGRPSGVVPVRIAGQVPRTIEPTPTGTTSPDDLTYHGGPVMRTNTTYAIYWAPPGYTMGANYRPLIDTFFRDVAADSGLGTNVYASDAQYFDGTGNIAYSSAFGGSVVDTAAYPASGCNDGTDPICLTDAQLQTEIYRVIRLQGWPSGVSSQYFIFTPQNVGSCLDGASSVCSYTYYCAYHSSFFQSGETYIYANQPYAGVSRCSFGQRPNNDPADDTINVVSHEHNEAITDPLGTGWWNDTTFKENGDNCAWNFGTPIGGTYGQEYNQLINGHRYFLQGEWSNASSSCVWATTAPVNALLPVISGTSAVGQALSASNGTWSGSPTSYAYQWLRCAADGTACSSIGGASGSTYVPVSADATKALRVSVTATNGSGTSGIATSNASVILGPPANTALPLISGTATVGQTLSASNGTWSGSPTSYAYQWSRCAADGTACSSIAGATGLSYVLAAADANQTLRVSVTASNASGAGTAALAAPSEVVAGVPVNVTPPSIIGSANLGAAVLASPGSWTAARTIAFAYQWARCDAQGNSCVPISGGTDTSYLPGVIDLGSTLRVTVTATSASFSASAPSAASSAVTDAHPAEPPTPVPQANRLPPPPTASTSGARPLPPVRR